MPYAFPFFVQELRRGDSVLFAVIMPRGRREIRGGTRLGLGATCGGKPPDIPRQFGVESRAPGDSVPTAYCAPNRMTIW